MAGGLFGQPFSINVKCVIFSLIIIALFLYKPNYQNQYLLYGILGLLFVLSYIAMAWYDFAFGCDILPLKKGKYSWQKALKPPVYESEKQIEGKETKKETNLKMYLIYFSHLIFIVPLLLYIAYYKNKINPAIYPLLGAIAFLTLIYHGYIFLNLVI